jgi:hypothetical protein
LTLDTNVVRERWSGQAKLEVVEKLVELAERGEAELAVTRYIRYDVPGGALAVRINKLAAEPNVSETGGVFTLDESRLDGQNGLGDQPFVDFQHALGADWRPKRGKTPDYRDWLHLHAHLIQRRDAFLTWDKGVLDLGEELRRAGFPIHVATPEVYLASRNA